jgi:diaminopropionate ammonia-lyase
MSLPEVSISQSHHNTAALAGQACPASVSDVLDIERCGLARDTISQWASYESTALHSLDGLASEIGIDALYYKDESTRFGLGSFKALGGAYAVQHVLRQALDTDVPDATVSLNDINSQRFADKVGKITVVTATDGNHGRSVAWGAQRFGCQCMIYMHENVSQGRQEAVEAFGAKVVRVAGNYDDSVRQADHDAKANGWHIVSDTSYPGYMEIPRDVMAGYTLMTTEAMDQLPQSVIPTHVFIQGGCGGLAGAVGADLWHRYGDKMPHLSVVEPVPAACLYESARTGEPQLVNITDESLMAGLSCGEVSLLGWQILKPCARHFLTISDAPVAPLMKLLAVGTSGDSAIVAGESAIAGLAGLIGAIRNEPLAREMNLNESSRVLVFGTEGATDPEVFKALVGTSAEHIAP